MIDLSSDSDCEPAPVLAKRVSVVKTAKCEPVESQESTDGDFVAADSHRFEEQVSLLAKLKLNSSHAKLCKICITCWRLVLVSECTGNAAAHKDHVITGTFEQMQAATKQTLKGLCQAKGKTKSGLHGQVVQLFGMSHEF